MNFDVKQDDRAVAAQPAQTPRTDAGVAPDDRERPVPPQPQQPQQHADGSDGAGELTPLFTPEAGREFRASWDAVQIGFVDDPQQAVRQADELVRQMLQNLAQTFSDERAGLDARGEGAVDADSTEKLRLALRRYRAFMQRLLSA